MNIVSLSGAFGFTTKFEYSDGDCSFVGANPRGGHWNVQYSKEYAMASLIAGDTTITFKYECDDDYNSGLDASIVVKQLDKFIAQMIARKTQCYIRYVETVNGHNVKQIFITRNHQTHYIKE